MQEKALHTDFGGERVRTALLQMGASRTNIDLSRDAAEAAARNYDLVREAYRKVHGELHASKILNRKIFFDSSQHIGDRNRRKN